MEIGCKAKPAKKWVAFPKGPKPGVVGGISCERHPPPHHRRSAWLRDTRKGRRRKTSLRYLTSMQSPETSARACTRRRSGPGFDSAAMVNAWPKAVAQLKQPDPPPQTAVASVISDGHSWQVFVHLARPNKSLKRIAWYQLQVAGGGMYSYEGFKKPRNGSQFCNMGIHQAIHLACIAHSQPPVAAR